ncbi:MAG TPA: NAD(P)/FAD-dependent oxidoreductase [Nitrospirae bacterium]|nr:sulfide dehydrogenase [flavocytochrome c] flavoprotein chain precursor [bacterium BMS3Abin06]HDH13443.1 NAD(P)/FAD-dependent oxidoreductase [Nitrospirota bacterium]HDZ01847.1 NAD(P)/FAD-dependent oxidoreductase [Nitrospirota bacterium]
MKKIVILGAGTGGTAIANKLRKALSPSEWEITVIDRDDNHVYQPGLLFVPFGLCTVNSLIRSRKQYISHGINFVIDPVKRVNHERNMVETDGGSFDYDWLIIGTGCRLAPEENEGLMDEWGKNAFSFYTTETAALLSNAMANFNGGKLLMCVAELPVKCPVAPIEFVFLADWYFRQKGIRNKVELHLSTPFPQCMPNWPRGRVIMMDAARNKGISMSTGFALQEVNKNGKFVQSFGGEKIDYDLLVIIPTNAGDQVIVESGLDDGSTFIPTDKHTLKALNHKNIYVIGDATNIPTSKAGSVAHYEAEVITHNLLAEIKGREPEPKYDGHSTCFIVSEKGKAYLVDFNYDTEPLYGKYPLPFAGPFSLLKETGMNWLGKLGFEWLYWNLLLPGKNMLLPPTLVMAGKKEQPE